MTKLRILFDPLAHTVSGWTLAAVVALGLISAPASTPAAASEVVLVCPADFRAAMEPWIEHRRGEGMSITVIPSEATSARLQTSIRAAADETTRYIVLAGDAPVIGMLCDPRRQIPIHYQPTSVTAAWGSTPTLASDLLYGDFDRDSLPDAVVGRLPVDTSEQLEKLVARII